MRTILANSLDATTPFLIGNSKVLPVRLSTTVIVFFLLREAGGLRKRVAEELQNAHPASPAAFSGATAAVSEPPSM